jgi:hypothetical protein
MAAVAAMATPVVASAQGPVIDGSALAIQEVVSGKTCIGDDVLAFGKNIARSGGTFERSGRAKATYSIGYGTILIRRNGNLHSHVTSVFVPDQMLYMSSSTYHCER